MHPIEAGGTRDELLRLIDAAPEWTSEAIPWPEIESLDEQVLPVFPADVLPDVLRKWVKAVSLATQTPTGLAGLLALAVCSAMLARRVVVELPGWREPVNLFVAILLGPGNRKSAVFESAVKPLRELEAEMIETVRPEIARKQSERRQDESRLGKLEKKAADKGDAEVRYEAGILAAELAEKPLPVLPRLLVDDATGEKLTMILGEQGGRVASMSPEGGVFDLMAGQYSKSGTTQFGVYLMGHSGDDMVSDRVGRGSIDVKQPALTCAYALQPSVIKGLAQNRAFRGRGLLARFLYAFPRSLVRHRKIATPAVPAEVHEEYHKKVRELGGLEGEQVLTLTPHALTVFNNWQHEIEEMLAEGGQMELMRDWGAKLAGATLRIAAVLHSVRHTPSGKIDAETIEAAIQIARYLIPHTGAVFGMMEAEEDTGNENALYIVRWIKRHRLTGFTKRDVQQHGKRRFPKANDLDPVLGELVRRGYIRERSSTPNGPGRPRSPGYEVNPVISAKKIPEKRSQYSQNSASRQQTDNSGNIGDTFPPSDTQCDLVTS